LICVDTSALISILRGEQTAEDCIARLKNEADIFVSAGTLAEAWIVAGARNVSAELGQLLEALAPTIEPVDEATAGQIGEAYVNWGKGARTAGLNVGDCFAYVLAKSKACPLLFVGDDFSRTDIEPAL
jgi:ribonuclease VapC